MPDLQITGLNESLWANGVLVAGNLQDTTTISLNGNTQANYTLVVQGTASGAQGGAYIMGYSVAAVPIPGAAVLFGSGLVAFAGLGRRAVKVQA